MATNTVTGVLNCADGRKIPLSSEIAESTEATLQTATAFTVTAQDIGDYMPGARVVSGLITALNGISYAYILRQGLILATIPVCVNGVASSTPPLCKPVTLQPGDVLRVLTLTASERDAALIVYTNRGVDRIFVGTPASGTTTQLLDLQTGNAIGNTLQGQRIVRAVFTSIDGAKIESPGGGAQVFDNLGNLAGAVACSDPASVQPIMSSEMIPVALNFTASVLTNA